MCKAQAQSTHMFCMVRVRRPSKQSSSRQVLRPPGGASASMHTAPPAVKCPVKLHTQLHLEFA